MPTLECRCGTSSFSAQVATPRFSTTKVFSYKFFRGNTYFMLNEVQNDESSPTGSSQTSLAYARLRRDILAGRLVPGEKLKIADLALSLKVSPGAIREALSRLVPEQLVVSRDQRGFVVTPLSIKDLEDLTDVRCEIEAIALRRSSERGGIEWEAAVMAAAHRLRGTPQVTLDDRPSLVPEWVDRHAAFHAALVGACGSKRLIDLHGLLYEQSERYRGLSVRMEGKRNVAGEHEEILKAALSHDGDRLVKAMLKHIRRTTAMILDAANRNDISLARPKRKSR